MKIKYLLASLLLPVAFGAFAAPFTISADGQEVTDVKTGLIWRRCTEGMTASANTCIGNASNFTHEAALTHASVQATSTGLPWRLPNVKELSSIVDRSRSGPAIDTSAFPATPTSLFWSSSPYIGFVGGVWVVYFTDGLVSGQSRSINPWYVRLVRASR
jgi:hypothetical protein